MGRERIKNFEQFWPFYLGEHQHPVNRGLHYLGTSSGLGLAGYALYSGRPLFLIVALVAAYGCAWLGHFVFEKNKPATFEHPVMSFIGDFKMFGSFLTGRIQRELETHSRDQSGKYLD